MKNPLHHNTICAVILIVFFIAWQSKQLSAQPQQTSDRLQVHTVKKGDNLTAIARQYQTTVQDIILRNRLRTDVIYPNQELIVLNRVSNASKRMASSRRISEAPLPGSSDLDTYLGKKRYAARMQQGNQYSPEAKRYRGEDPGLQNTARRTASSPSGFHLYHTVRQGQNLQQIASLYGVTVTELRETNHIQEAQAGQRIKIDPFRLADVRTTSPRNTNRRLSQIQIQEDVFSHHDDYLNDWPSYVAHEDQGQQLRGNPLARLAGPQGNTRGSQSASETSFTHKEQGSYERFHAPNLADQPYYAAHRSLPVGSWVSIALPTSGKVLEVEIIARLSTIDKTIIGVSPACLERMYQGGVEKTISLFHHSP